MRKKITILFALILMCFTHPANAKLDIDISKPHLEITTGFTGDTLTLFGTANPSGDIIIVVRGPQSQTTIHKKTKIAGIWIHGQSVTFNDVPGYYMTSSTRPIAGIIPANIRIDNSIGINSLNFKPDDAISNDKKNRFQEALIQNMQLKGLFSLTANNVHYINDHLFKTNIHMPSNVPTGRYTIEAFLFRKGKLIDQSNIPFQITQGGLAGNIHDFAYNAPFFYGLTAILMALFSSFLAVMLLRRE